MRSISRSGVSHDRWLISYSDLVTLLLAVFAVLFASSRADRRKNAQHVHLIQSQSQTPPPLSRAASPDGSAHRDSEVDPEADDFLRALGPELQSGRMQVRSEERGLIVSLSEGAFFPSGENSVDTAMYSSLARLATLIRRSGRPIRLEGHTDSQPVHNLRYRSNWELSTARAIAVMELLNDQFGITSDRMSVSGYADTLPLDSNLTMAGRAHNRRVDVVILNAASAGRDATPR